MMRIPTLTWMSIIFYVHSQIPKHMLYFSCSLELTNGVLWYSFCPKVM